MLAGGYVSLDLVVSFRLFRWFRLSCSSRFGCQLVLFWTFRFGSFGRFGRFSRLVVSGFSLCPEEQQKFYPVKISLKHVHTVNNR